MTRQRQITADTLRSLPSQKVKEIFEVLGPQKTEELKHDWNFWARDAQLEPDRDWNTWFINAGRGFGKTRTGVEWVREQVKLGKKLADQLTDEQIGLISKYYNSLSDKESSELDSQLVQGRNNTELHAMAESMASERKDKIISNNKITLTQKDVVEVNPWINISTRYSIPSVVEATVKSKKDYGLFINIEDGVTGLLHVSEIGEETMTVFNPGDKITVQITRIDEGTMKVFLKMPQ